MKYFKYMVLVFLVFLLFATNSFAQVNNKTKFNNQKLRKYCNEVPIDNVIGQLFIVGLPDVDYTTYMSTEEDTVYKIIKEVGVGGVMLNTYNFYIKDSIYDKIGKEEYLSRIQKMINFFQSISIKRKNGIPLFVAIDFESQYSSILKGVNLVPSALTMGHVQKLNLIQDLGELVGNQLTSIGINMILGPVLDTPKNVSGKYDSTLSNRYFSSNIDVTNAVASSYLKGLRNKNIIPIVKHFPGYCEIDQGIHNAERPEFIGDYDILDNNIKLYNSLSKNYMGLMTANYYNNKISEEVPFFLSSKFNDILKGNKSELKIDDKIIITDDLSNMEIIESYKNKNNYSYSDIAIQAFNSGHDILLYSHLGDKGHIGEFIINDFIKVVSNLKEYIKDNKSAEKKFRNSLYKILKAKIKYGYKIGHKINLANNANKLTFQTVWKTKEYRDLFNKIQIKNFSNKYSSNSELIDKIISEGSVLINDNGNSIENKNILIIADNSEKLRNGISNNSKDIKVKKIPSNFKSTSELDNEVNEIIDLINKKNDMIIFVVDSKDDGTIIEKLDYKNIISENKVIILNHFNPIIFNKNILSKYMIFNTMTNLKSSYNIDIEFLLGKSDYNDEFKINLGRNNSYNEVSDKKYNFINSNEEHPESLIKSVNQKSELNKKIINASKINQDFSKKLQEEYDENEKLNKKLEMRNLIIIFLLSMITSIITKIYLNTKELISKLRNIVVLFNE